MPHSLRETAIVSGRDCHSLYLLTKLPRFLNGFLHATGVEIWRLGIIVVTLQRIRGYALRVKAAAQHSSSELGSAFALHFPCNVKGEETTGSAQTWRIGDRHKN